MACVSIRISNNNNFSFTIINLRREGKIMTFSDTGAGLLLFYATGGILLIAIMLLYLVAKK